MTNPLLSDRDVAFLLYEVLDVEALCQLPHYADHDRGTFDLYLGSARKLAREVLFPSYRAIDEEPPELCNGRVKVHPKMHDAFTRLVELGVLGATRPYEIGGQQLPVTIFSMANAYLMAANASAYAYLGLTTGAARLIESFGSEELRQRYMAPMYAGQYAGTMALTEPHAGSSLADVTTRATQVGSSHYLIEGTKIFISGGDQDLTENIVHLALARITGAPAGIKGVSLFAIPAKRDEGGKLTDNDCITSGVFHKIGWRGIASIALTLGDRGDCHGYLVGEPHRGIHYMFQMMNEARIMVGLNGVASAAVAYQEALQYARERPQGRRLTQRDPEKPQVPIIEHADVRRMLLRQKAIVEGGMALVMAAARYQDFAEHGETATGREHAQILVDLLTPVAKSFPAERGFEANTLAIQVHGGYGYTSEYLPEAWWRDQKLNSIHEGTTTIHSLDLLGRKVMHNGGQALRLFADEVQAAVTEARSQGVAADWCSKVEGALSAVANVSMHLGGLGLGGDVEAMLRHSADYLEMFSIVTVGWQWLVMAAAAKRGLTAGTAGSEDFYRGKLSAAQYWINTELPRVGYLAALCRSGEDSYATIKPDWF